MRRFKWFILLNGPHVDTHVDRRRIDAEVVELARSLGLGELLQHKPGQLSGGQCQRAALARAMVRQLAAFLMNEPLSNLYAKLRIKVPDELAVLHRRLGATFVTHDQTEAMSLSTRVAVMQHGRMCRETEPAESALLLRCASQVNVAWPLCLAPMGGGRRRPASGRSVRRRSISGVVWSTTNCTRRGFAAPA